MDALHGVPCTPSERLAIAFFGVRGIGSLYYVAFTLLGHADPDEEGSCRSTVGLAVVDRSSSAADRHARSCKGSTTHGSK